MNAQTKKNINIRHLQTADSRHVVTLDLHNLRASDRIFIRTENNLYRFHITDAKTLSGILRGEWRKCRFPEARLLGAVIEVKEQLHTLNTQLQTAARALFLVHQRGDLWQLITSTVISLGWFIDRDDDNF